MASVYQEDQRAKNIHYLKTKNPCFYGGTPGFSYRGKKRDFWLVEDLKNLYEPISDEVIRYFNKNKISWWGGRNPTGHTLSSQISCINHLFPIRYDHQAVLKILQLFNPEFIEVLTIETDAFPPAYIQFESVSDSDHLSEGVPTRGNNCTSIDALMFALHKDGSKWIVPIEWKYTEYYENDDKSKGPKGPIRLGRYTSLITGSHQLTSVSHTCYYYEPFYQLMRQTLWAEQMINFKSTETIQADNYLHIHVIPKNNFDLKNKKYKCSGLDMEQTWRSHLKDQSKYKIYEPDTLIKLIASNPYYSSLRRYLEERYWF